MLGMDHPIPSNGATIFVLSLMAVLMLPMIVKGTHMFAVSVLYQPVIRNVFLLSIIFYIWLFHLLLTGHMLPL